MYIIKSKPEDFIVNEIPDREWQENGKYLVLKVKKTNLNTEYIAQYICKTLGLKRSLLTYAGTKDRNAITTQFFSIKDASKSHLERLRLDGATFSFAGFTSEPLSLGSLKGNEFIITVRNLEPNQMPHPLTIMPNYFGPQRFGVSGTNAEIGKLFIKKNFEEASKLIIEAGGDQATSLKESLAKQEHNYSTAFRSIPKKILSIYVHAYQSLLFNEMLEELVKTVSSKDFVGLKIPLIGFDTDEPDFPPLRTVFNKILEREQLTQRDFIIREIPDLTSEGDMRSATIPIEHLVLGTPEHDEENPGKQKITIAFTLPKGAYATVAIKELFGES